MTHPLPEASFTVVPDAVEALAAELGTLAAELDEDGDRTRPRRGVLPRGTRRPRGLGRRRRRHRLGPPVRGRGGPHPRAGVSRSRPLLRPTGQRTRSWRGRLPR